MQHWQQPRQNDVQLGVGDYRRELGKAADGAVDRVRVAVFEHTKQLIEQTRPSLWPIPIRDLGNNVSRRGPHAVTRIADCGQQCVANMRFGLVRRHVHAFFVLLGQRCPMLPNILLQHHERKLPDRHLLAGRRSHARQNNRIR